LMPLRFKSPVVVEPLRFTWFDVELPDPGPYEAIFRNRACLVCGSDLHVYKGLHPFAPLPACCGHEVAADVWKVGEKVSTLRVGDRVYFSGAGARATPCGQCFYCGRGDPGKCLNPHPAPSLKIGGKFVARFPSGFGEYTMGHEAVAYKIPDNVSYSDAAVITDLAYVTGVIKRSGAGIGKSVVVIGAGPIGLRTLEVVKLTGASPIIVCETVKYRLAKARELGADEAVNPAEEDAVERVLQATDGAGIDIVYDTTGNTAATNQGMSMLKKRIGGAGTLCLMGLFEQPNLTLDVSALMYKAGRIFAEWGLSEGPKSIEDSLSMLSRGKVRPSEWITHRFPEDRADEAMNLLVAKRDNAIGVEIVR